MLRHRKAAAPAGDPLRVAVFLLCPEPPSLPSQGEPVRVPMLDNGLHPVVGRLWFVNAAVASGRFVELPEVDDDQLFRHVTETLGLGSYPAVVFDPRTPVLQVRFYNAGMADPDQYNALRVSGQVSIDEILAVVDSVYRQCLVTPDAQPPNAKLWVSKPVRAPVKHAEALIQANVKAGLCAAFPGCSVRHEQVQVSGRLDIEVEESDPTDPTVIVRYALLELKVLRSFYSTGEEVSLQECLESVEEGVRQAIVYRRERKARAAALCCFDMRRTDSGDACFEAVASAAVGAGLRLRRWFLFASSRAFRKATALSPAP